MGAGSIRSVRRTDAGSTSLTLARFAGPFGREAAPPRGREQATVGDRSGAVAATGFGPGYAGASVLVSAALRRASGTLSLSLSLSLGSCRWRAAYARLGLLD